MIITSSHQVPIFLAVFTTLYVITAKSQLTPANCSQTCPGAGGSGGRRGPTPSVTFHYPLGFSPGCPIQLNCTPTGNALIGGFSVMRFTDDAVTVTIPAQCNRSASLIEGLYGPHFAPTSNNAVLLYNCSKPSVSCPLPSAMATTRFESQCAYEGNSSMSCYSEQGRNSSAEFIDLTWVRGLNCGYFLSGISVVTSDVSVSLDVRTIELGWWLDGDCRCDEEAECTNVTIPDGRRGFRCRCRDGFAGDGFAEGVGCRRESPACNPAKFLSGHCGGTPESLS